MLSFVKLIPAIISLISLAWRTLVSAKDRQLGRAEAVREALEKQAAENKEAVEAFNRAEKAHSDHPDDNDAFDPDFMRKQ